MPTRPPEADAATEAGAAAFARYWVDVFNADLEAIDPAGIAAISESSCQTCQAYIASLRESTAGRESYRGGRIVVREAVTTPLEGRQATVLVNCDTAALEVLNSEGVLIKTVPAELNTTLQFQLEHVGTTWVAAEVAQV